MIESHFYYNPKIGRFITEDSYGGEDKDPLSLNLYTYCANDSVNQADPSGHCWIPYSSKRENDYKKAHGAFYVYKKSGFRRVPNPAGTYDEVPCKLMWNGYCDFKGNDPQHQNDRLEVDGGMNMVQASITYDDDRSETQ